jgi:Cu(I)/Ag(I) efflux system membrane fusion protein
VLAEIADIRSVNVISQIPQEDLALVQVGQGVQVQTSAGNSATFDGVVTAVQPVLDHAAAGAGVRIQVDSPAEQLHPGTIVTVHWHVPVADIEPFRSLPRDPRPLAAGDVREAFRCQDHPTFVYVKRGACPFDKKPLESVRLANHQRLEWHCPAHTDVNAKQPFNCDRCGELPLLPAIISYSPAGHVLSIPDSAVIDTGNAQIVFVESGPGMYDAIRIQVGPLCDGLRAVIAGLESEQRVVTSGAFLLDAETRLNPNLSANYFGAGSQTGAQRGTSIQSSNDDEIRSRLEELALPAADAARINAQRVCPTTHFALGSMGKPVRVRVGEYVVYLCCSGCTSRIEGAIDWPIEDQDIKDQDKEKSPPADSPPRGSR